MNDSLLIKKKYIFWTNDPNVLYSDDEYLNFIPTPSMTRIEKLNALTRFFIYYIIISLLFQFNTKYLYIPITGIIFIIILYNIYQSDPKGKEKELYKDKQSTKPKKEDFGIANTNDKVEYNLESGYYDSNGNLNINKEYTINSRGGNDSIKYSANELQEYQRNICKRPTKDNPFMNPPITDFNDGFKPSACNADDEDIKDNTNTAFNTDLYRNIEDLFEVKNSQRQFYTVPTTAIPNDQVAFANWLYKSPTTCKETSCLRYEDLRFKR